MLKERILKILALENRLNTDEDFKKSCAAPEKCYLTGDGEILCYPRTTGDSRHPYSHDGFTLWAYSSGEMSLNESAFYYILPADEGKEPYIAFYGGKKTDDGYIPVSVTGVARQGKEKDVSRFTYYTPQAVYYITKTHDVVYYLRAYVSEKKQAVFSLGALNLTNKPIKTYLSAFLNCLLMHQAGENVETKWFKQCKTTDHGFIYESVEDLDRTTHLKNYGVINRACQADIDYVEHTTSRSDYVGGKTNSLCFATPLFTGHFEKQAKICKFGDTAAAGDMYAITLPKNGCAQIDYIAEAYYNIDEAESAIRAIAPDYSDKTLQAAEKKYADKIADKSMLKMQFGKFEDCGINAETFT